MTWQMQVFGFCFPWWVFCYYFHTDLNYKLTFKDSRKEIVRFWNNILVLSLIIMPCDMMIFLFPFFLISFFVFWSKFIWMLKILSLLQFSAQLSCKSHSICQRIFVCSWWISAQLSDLLAWTMSSIYIVMLQSILLFLFSMTLCPHY